MADYIVPVAYDTIEGRLKAMDRDGFVYFPQLIKQDEVEQLRSHMEALEGMPESFDQDSTQDLNTGRYGSNSPFLNKHINNCFNRDPFFLKYLDYPEIIDVWEAIHGSDCHVIAMTSWITGPGRPDQDLHADWQPYSLPEEYMQDPRVQMPNYISTFHVYLDDLYEELGPTKVIPGSHKAGRKPKKGEDNWKGQTAKSVMVKSGDATIHRAEIWHRGSANKSNKNRYLLQTACAQRMITQKFPPYLSRFRFNKDILAQATPRQLKMLGDHERGNFD